jgi:ribosome-associated protein
MRKLADVLAEQAREDDRDLRSRGDARRERRAEETRLAELASRLVATSDKVLASLDLPEEALDAVRDAQKITSTVAQNRQLRVVRRTLREADSEGIRLRLEQRISPSRHGNTARRAATRWCERLIEEGDAALQELVDAFPGVDRQRTRHLLRQATVATNAERAAKARAALLEALQAALSSNATETRDDVDPL